MLSQSRQRQAKLEWGYLAGAQEWAASGGCEQDVVRTEREGEHKLHAASPVSVCAQPLGVAGGGGWLLPLP